MGSHDLEKHGKGRSGWWWGQLEIKAAGKKLKYRMYPMWVHSVEKVIPRATIVSVMC